MCIACLEYNKAKLNLNEFKSALREMTMEDQEHFMEVERLIAHYGDKPEELKKHLEALGRIPKVPPIR